MLDEYYAIRGWRREDGVPTAERLRTLGLDFAVSAMPDGR
jgi:aldehyde:ferredoxin oxidoreductase